MVSYKNILEIYSYLIIEETMENKKGMKVEPLSFFSNDMTVAKDQLAHNHLKLTYQRDSVTDLEQKHKEWAQEDTAS